MLVTDRRALCFITYQNIEGLSHVINGRAFAIWDFRDPFTYKYRSVSEPCRSTDTSLSIFIDVKVFLYL